MIEQPDVVVYAAPGVNISLPFDPVSETVWASKAQIGELFGAARSNVSRHINAVFASGEVDRSSNLRKTQTARSNKPVNLYSLDVVLAVGYRTNSARAITFRRWANGVLKDYLVKGAALDEERLEKLGLLVEIASRSSDELVAGVAEVLARYLPGLQLLREYDDGAIPTSPSAEPSWSLSIEEAREIIAAVSAEFPADGLFGLDRDDTLEGVLHTLYPGIGGRARYPTVEKELMIALIMRLLST